MRKQVDCSKCWRFKGYGTKCKTNVYSMKVKKSCVFFYHKRLVRKSILKEKLPSFNNPFPFMDYTKTNSSTVMYAVMDKNKNVLEIAMDKEQLTHLINKDRKLYVKIIDKNKRDWEVSKP